MQVTETALKAAAASANEDCCPPLLKGEKKTKQTTEDHLVLPKHLMKK